MDELELNDENFIVFPRKEFVQWWGQIQVGGTEHYHPCPDPVDNAIARVRAQHEWEME